MTQAAEQQSNRKRFSFGPVWAKSVIDGKAKDKEKLIAHAVKLKVAAKSVVSGYKLETLLAKVAAALQAEPAKEEDGTKAKPASKAKPKAEAKAKDEKPKAEPAKDEKEHKPEAKAKDHEAAPAAA